MVIIDYYRPFSRGYRYNSPAHWSDKPSLLPDWVYPSNSHLEDALFEAGCDALINYKNGTVYLDFDREDEDLEHGRALSHCEGWCKSHIPLMATLLASQRISELLASITFVCPTKQ